METMSPHEERIINEITTEEQLRKMEMLRKSFVYDCLVHIKNRKYEELEDHIRNYRALYDTEHANPLTQEDLEIVRLELYNAESMTIPQKIIKNIDDLLGTVK